MNVEYINPFIESVYDLFSTMLSAKAERGNVAIARGDGAFRDIVALIGLSGQICGMVAMAFPIKTALNIVNRLLGTELRIIDDTVSDAIAEVVNIVGGGAKAKLTGDSGPPVSLSLPSVVRGNSFCVDYPTKTTWLEVPFNSELGPFTMRVTFKAEAKKGGA